MIPIAYFNRNLYYHLDSAAQTHKGNQLYTNKLFLFNAFGKQINGKNVSNTHPLTIKVHYDRTYFKECGIYNIDEIGKSQYTIYKINEINLKLHKFVFDYLKPRHFIETIFSTNNDCFEFSITASIEDIDHLVRIKRYPSTLFNQMLLVLHSVMLIISTFIFVFTSLIILTNPEKLSFLPAKIVILLLLACAITTVALAIMLRPLYMAIWCCRNSKKRFAQNNG